MVDERAHAVEADVELPRADFLAEAATPVLYVLTKIDKLNRSGRQAALESVRRELEAPSDQVLATSARTREGLDTLVESIFALVNPVEAP